MMLQMVFLISGRQRALKRQRQQVMQLFVINMVMVQCKKYDLDHQVNEYGENVLGIASEARISRTSIEFLVNTTL